MRTPSNRTRASARASIVRRMVIAGIAAGTAMSIGAGSALAEMLCGEREDIVQALQLNWQEDRTAIGLSNTGAVLEVFSSAQGSWTLLMTTPDGPTCLISAGEHWETMQLAELVGEPV